jgi:hypothetical protein
MLYDTLTSYLPREAHKQAFRTYVHCFNPQNLINIPDFKIPQQPSVSVDPVSVSGRWYHVDVGCMRYGCEVPGMVLLQASYLYTYSLLGGVTFQYSPSAAMPNNAATVGHIPGTPIVEWLSVPSALCVCVSSTTCNIHPFKADLIFGNRSHLDRNQGNKMGVPVQ